MYHIKITTDNVMDLEYGLLYLPAIFTVFAFDEMIGFGTANNSMGLSGTKWVDKKVLDIITIFEYDDYRWLNEAVKQIRT